MLEVEIACPSLEDALTTLKKLKEKQMAVWRRNY